MRRECTESRVPRGSPAEAWVRNANIFRNGEVQKGCRPPPSPNSTRSQDLGEEEDRVKKEILKEKRFGGKTKGGRINGLL